MNSDIYVVPCFGNWAIRQMGKDMPMSTHNNKNEAIRVANQLNKKWNCKVHILEEDFTNYKND